MNELATRQNETDIQAVAGNPISAMMHAIIDKGVTSDNAAALEKMADLFIRMEAENARKAFAIAKCELQAELPKVIAGRTIPNKDGTVRSTFAAYEDIMKQIAPHLTKHGFSVSFNMKNISENGKDRICAVCRLTHRSGHYEENEFAVRISAPPGSSDAQADGSTRSYARRGALCDCLNIVIDHDNDARAEGDYISEQQAIELEARVRAVKGDVAKFLKLADAASFGEIRQTKYGMLDNTLAKKELAAQKGQQ